MKQVDKKVVDDGKRYLNDKIFGAFAEIIDDTVYGQSIFFAQSGGQLEIVVLFADTHVTLDNLRRYGVGASVVDGNLEFVYLACYPQQVVADIIGKHIGGLSVDFDTYLTAITNYPLRYSVVVYGGGVEKDAYAFYLFDIFLSSVEFIVFIAKNESCGLHGSFQIEFKFVDVAFEVLSLFDYHHQTLCHKRVTACFDYNVFHLDVFAVHYGLVHITFVFGNGVLLYVIGYLIDEIRFIAHKKVYRSVSTCFEVCHYFVEREFVIFFCHIFLTFAENNFCSYYFYK